MLLGQVVANSRRTGVIHSGQRISYYFHHLGHFGLAWVYKDQKPMWQYHHPGASPPHVLTSIYVAQYHPFHCAQRVRYHLFILYLHPLFHVFLLPYSLLIADGQNHACLDLNDTPLSRYSSLSMLSLIDLPPELVEQITSVFADGEPPSAKFIYQQPSKDLLNQRCHPLKDLSCVCQGLRQICFFNLFSALKVNLEVSTGFLDFIKSSQLVGRVDSLAIYTTPECLDKPMHRSA